MAAAFALLRDSLAPWLRRPFRVILNFIVHPAAEGHANEPFHLRGAPEEEGERALRERALTAVA